MLTHADVCWRMLTYACSCSGCGARWMRAHTSPISPLSSKRSSPVAPSPLSPALTPPPPPPQLPPPPPPPPQLPARGVSRSAALRRFICAPAPPAPLMTTLPPPRRLLSPPTKWLQWLLWALSTPDVCRPRLPGAMRLEARACRCYRPSHPPTHTAAVLRRGGCHGVACRSFLPAP
jgi:hypothetical protein